MSQCSKRFGEANNSYIENFDSSKDTPHLLYINCNNLYGNSMVQSLPIEGFKWVDNLEL